MTGPDDGTYPRARARPLPTKLPGRHSRGLIGATGDGRRPGPWSGAFWV